METIAFQGREARSATLTIVCALAVGAYAAAFIGTYLAQTWLFDQQGRPIDSDFISFWSAGKLALQGEGARAYDWDFLRTIQIAGVGHDFSGRYHWPYPPHLLLVYAPLALIAYPWGHLVWMALTIPLYAWAVRLVAPRPGVVLAALAFPAAFWNFGIGQNGFLAAGLLGASFALLDRRPLLAGVLIGLLTYKPQLGLFIPIALIAGGHWRTIAAASLATIVLIAASALAFGPEAWTAFFGSMGESNRIILVEGGAGFSELLSAFGVVRWLGGGVLSAWAVQGSLVLALGVATWLAWRSDRPEHDKRALLVAAVVMGSPYCFIYDLVPLAIAIAFLARAGLSERERAAIGVVCLLTLAGPISGAPIAALAAPIVLGVALLRLTRGHADVQPVGNELAR